MDKSHWLQYRITALELEIELLTRAGETFLAEILEKAKDLLQKEWEKLRGPTG
jgi:hypothetical protein